MNKIVLSLVFILISFTAISAQGISFYKGSWEEALIEAQAQDKIIFVDAYAKWCGPCKRMAKNVFTQDKVGAFFNDNFINLKLDMEEAEGLTFGKNYPVTAFPTLFFLDSEGNILKKSVGGKQAEDLIELGRMAIKSFDRSDQYAERYEEGERDFDLVYNYIKELNKVSKPSLKISNEYLDSKPDISNKQKALFLTEAVLESDSKLFDELLALKSEAIAATSEEEFEKTVSQACLKTVEKAVEYDYAALLEESIAQFNAASIGDKKQFEMEARLYYNALAGNYDAWKGHSEKFLKKFGKKNPAFYKEQLSQIAKYFSYVDASKDYGYELMEKLVKIEKTADNYLLYMRMLMNDRKLSEAYEIGKEALSKFEDSPFYDQFRQMVNYIEKQQIN